MKAYKIAGISLDSQIGTFYTNVKPYLQHGAVIVHEDNDTIHTIHVHSLTAYPQWTWWYSETGWDEETGEPN